MNEKEYKESVRSGAPVCSISGRPCECLAGGGCKNRESVLDGLPDETVRALKTLWLHLDIARQDTLIINDDASFERRFPQPEVRDMRRKLDAMLRDLEGWLS